MQAIKVVIYSHNLLTVTLFEDSCITEGYCKFYIVPMKLCQSKFTGPSSFHIYSILSTDIQICCKVACGASAKR